VVAEELLVHELGSHVHRVSQTVFGRRPLRPRQQLLALVLREQLLRYQIRFRSSGVSLSTTTCRLLTSVTSDSRPASTYDGVMVATQDWRYVSCTWPL